MCFEICDRSGWSYFVCFPLEMGFHIIWVKEHQHFWYFLDFQKAKSTSLHVHLILKLQVFYLALDVLCCPHFPAWLEMGFYFQKISFSRREINIFVSEIQSSIKISYNQKLRKLQDPPALHDSRQIQLSYSTDKCMREKSYWLAQKVVNGRGENYTF